MSLARYRGYNFLRTLLFNYRMFPRAVAKKLPVKVGWRADLKGLSKGSIRFREGVEPHRFMVRIGCSSWQLYSNRSMRTLIWMTSGSRLTLGEDIDFCCGSRVVITAGGEISLGDDFFLNQNSLLYCSSAITFGNHCTIGWDSQIYDTDFHIIENIATGESPTPVAPVVAGENVWIANRCTVAKGAVLPSRCIVASNSLVNKDFSDLEGQGILLAGVPAALKRTGIARLTDKRRESKLRKSFLRDKTNKNR